MIVSVETNRRIVWFCTALLVAALSCYVLAEVWLSVQEARVERILSETEISGIDFDQTPLVEALEALNRKVAEGNPSAPRSLIHLEIRPERIRTKEADFSEMARDFGWDPADKYWVNPETKITLKLEHPVPAAEATRYTAALATSRYYIVGSKIIIGPVCGYPPRRPWQRAIDRFEELFDRD
jgi:hypothetical protein